MKTKQLNIRINADVHNGIKKLAKEENRSVSNMIETILIEHLKAMTSLKEKKMFNYKKETKNMRKVNLDELAELLGNDAMARSGEFYSTKLEDWIDDIRSAEYNSDDYVDGNTIYYRCPLEVRIGKELIHHEFVIVNEFNENDEIINTEHYVYENAFKRID